MQWQGIKIHVVVVSVIIALAVFFGAHWLYNSLNFREPLKKELNAHDLVTDYRIEEDKNGSYRVLVSIKETGNLMLAYLQVYESVQEVMGNQQFVIKLVDHRDDLLNEIYNEGQFAVQEAMVQGNFREMARTLNESARRAGVSCEVFIDDNNIYWQMRHGEHYLYEVVPRPLSPGTMPDDAAPGRR